MVVVWTRIQLKGLASKFSLFRPERVRQTVRDLTSSVARILLNSFKRFSDATTLRSEPCGKLDAALGISCATR